MSWAPAPGAVVRYKLTYVGDNDIREAFTHGTETNIILHQLLPLTTYRVSVAAEYSSGTGEERETDGTTKEGEFQ